MFVLYKANFYNKVFYFIFILFCSKNFTVLWSIMFSERIYAWLPDEKPIHYKISDISIWIFIHELILIDELNAKRYVEILYSYLLYDSICLYNNLITYSPVKRMGFEIFFEEEGACGTNLSVQNNGMLFLKYCYW